jgi:RNA polymerase sigma-70 factor (ECF subfamily)
MEPEPPQSPAAREHELVPLMRAIAAGDRPALSQLYSRTSAKLYGICRRVLGSETDAEDVLQEIYVLVWRNAARFDPAKASPITWLAVLARNRSIDRLRARTAPNVDLEAASHLSDDAKSPFEILETVQESSRLAGCLDELEDRQKSMIRSAFFDGATYSQLAEHEGVPLGTMKSWIRRGLLRLRGCLQR